MTEKRYKLHYNYHFGYGVEDTYNSDRLYLDEFELLVDELNTLNDENEQLKKELKQEKYLHKQTTNELNEYKDFMGLG